MTCSLSQLFKRVSDSFNKFPGARTCVRSEMEKREEEREEDRKEDKGEEECGYWKEILHSPTLKVVSSASKGRHLVARRLIRPGEVVLRETPAVTGPSTKSKPQCLQCCRELTPGTTRDCRGCSNIFSFS